MLLLHVCCADCFLKYKNSIKTYSEFYNTNLEDKIQIFFYNPNIHPISEYRARLNALKKVATNFKIVVPDFRIQEFFDAQVLKDLNVNSILDELNLRVSRCNKCWALRLYRTVIYAKENNFTKFSTTLFASSYQSREVIYKIGSFLSKKYDIDFVFFDVKDIKTAGFYKQNYCGCIYSLLEKYNKKYL